MSEKIYLPYYLRMPARYGEFDVTYFEFCDTETLDFFHKHMYIELCYVLEGAVSIVLENMSIIVPCLHCVLIEPGCIHKYVTAADSQTRYFILRFDQALKNPVKNDYQEVGFFKRLEKSLTSSKTQIVLADSWHCDKIIMHIREELLGEKYGYKVIMGNLCSDLIFLTLRNLPAIIHTDNYQDMNPYTDRNNDLMQIVHYIQLHYNEPLTAKSVAEIFHVSERQLTRWLKDYLGQGFNDILSYFRYEAAKKLFAEDLSLEEISYQIGFQSTRSLYNLFAKYETTSIKELRHIYAPELK